MSSKRFNNVVAALGDSLTWMGEGYKLNRQNWLSILEYALGGFATSSVVAVSGKNLTVAPGTGAWFQPGTSFILRPAGISVRGNRTGRSSVKGAHFTVESLSGDTLTTSSVLPTNVAVGVQVLGTGGGCNVVGLNCGHSGDTTAQMLARVGQMFALGTPGLALILGGVNDLNPQGSSAVQSTPVSSTTNIYVAHGSAAALACPGSYLVINGNAGKSVASVNVGSGNAPDLIVLASPLGTAPVAGVTVAVDTLNNLIAIGRMIASGGVSNMLMLGNPGCNWPSGGDWPTVNVTTSTIRSIQQAAATALGIPFCSIFSLMNSRVSANIDGGTGNSYTYGNISGNPHPSIYGDQVYAMAAMAGIASQPGWLSALT